MELKRVVVTGLGALTPIGNTKDKFWEGLISGKSGAAPITYYDTEKFKTKFACELKNFTVTDFIDRKEARKMDKFAQYAMVAADEAILDSKLDLDEVNKLRVGVIWGAGIGGLETFQNEVLNFAEGDGTPVCTHPSPVTVEPDTDAKAQSYVTKDEREKITRELFEADDAIKGLTNDVADPPRPTTPLANPSPNEAAAEDDERPVAENTTAGEPAPGQAPTAEEAEELPTTPRSPRGG